MAVGIVGAMMLAVGCKSGSGEGGAEGETSAMIEDAHLKGREAARVFVNTAWKDTMELQGKLLEASAKKSEFAGKKQCEAAFDSAFISTVRTVRPEIARELERCKARQ